MNRRQIGEENYRQKFEELGLSDSFDFIRRDWNSDKGTKVLVRCKTCGTEFYTWGFKEMLKGRQSHLLCIGCGAASDGADVWERSPRCDEAMAYYTDGHTVRQTAKKFGVPESQINNSVKKRGLTNGRQWNEPSDAHKEAVRKDAEHRLTERIDSLGFDYLGGFTVMAEKVTIKCRTCGDVFERTADFAMHGNLICKKCEHEKTLIRQEKRRIVRRAEAERRQAEREAQKLEQNPLGLSKRELEKQKKLDTICTCTVCGKKYTPRQYMESEGLILFSNVGYCSHECKRKAMNRLCKANKRARGVQDNHRHRAQKYGCEYDPSVTLPKLIKRDGLRCAICGEMCDPKDHSWSQYSGPMYPSIDHIVPMSRGGGHVWGNVRVVHIICNSEKGDKIDKVV